MRVVVVLVSAGAALASTVAVANDVHEVKCKGNSSACIGEAQQTCGGDYHVLFSESHA